MTRSKYVFHRLRKSTFMSMKNSSDAIGNRNRDLPACSVVPQPTAPPGAPTMTVP